MCRDRCGVPVWVPSVRTQTEVVELRIEEARKFADAELERLAAALERGESDTMKSYLAAMGRFWRYSLRNAMLIAAQRPSAQHVAGFHTWKKLGRHVRKGERGIVILAPVVRRTRRDTSRAKRKAVEANQNDVDDLPENIVAFRGAYVFDVSQTDGKSLPEFAQVSGDPGSYTERLKAFVAKQGIELDYSERIAPAQGTSSGGRITLLPGLSPAEELSVLAHEVAHEMTHKAKEREQLTKAVCETEAEAVAYVVCQSAGLETNSSSSDYVQLWGGDAKTLTASLDRIQKTAAEMIEAIGSDA